MTDDDGTTGPGADTPTDPIAPPRSGTRPPVRRHLVVLGIGVAALILGIVLVVTGRSSSSDPPDTVVADTTVASDAATGPLLPDLGTVGDDHAARALVGDLDPAELGAGGVPAGADPAPTVPGVDLTMAGVQRCGQAITQQNADRSLGDPLDAARLVVGDTPTLVVSYAMPASGDLPAADRVLVVDARTCRILTAVEH